MNKDDLKISDMLDLSKKLWYENREKWSPMSPEYGKDFILYMIEEIGEVVAIIKKKNINDIMDNEEVRERFVEELSDVMMYYMDVLNRFGIDSEEFTKSYLKKFETNMNRDYSKEYDDYI